MKKFFLLLSLVVLPLNSYADSVYRWEAKNGSIHYSTKPPQPGAKPAELPPIMKGDIRLAKSYFISCDKHGGINCKGGTDVDGSVICNDGFKNSSLQYKKSCAGKSEESRAQLSH